MKPGYSFWGFDTGSTKLTYTISLSLLLFPFPSFANMITSKSVSTIPSIVRILKLEI